MFHPSAQDRIRRLLAAAVIVATAMIALAASPALAQVATLGSPPPEAEASSAPAEELSEHDAMLAYAECMRDNGVEVTDPVFDASGNLVGGLEFEGGKDAAAKDAKSEDFQAASEACGDLLVAFKPAADPALDAEQTEAALRFAACMREQGRLQPARGAGPYSHAQRAHWRQELPGMPCRRARPTVGLPGSQCPNSRQLTPGQCHSWRAGHLSDAHFANP